MTECLPVDGSYEIGKFKIELVNKTNLKISGMFYENTISIHPSSEKEIIVELNKRKHKRRT